MAHIHRQIGRRSFLRRAATLTAAAGTPFLADLFTIAAASAAGANDHKALVCVWLGGGNDQSNLLVPLDPRLYAAYQATRTNLALPAANLLAINPVGMPAGSLGLHPSLATLKPLFDSSSLGILANVGTLAQPTTKAQWNAGKALVPVPTQLFSHSDQTGVWQTGVPDHLSNSGWLGRVGDLTQGAFNAGSGVSISMSVAGNAILMSGESVIQYQVSTQGALPVNALAYGAYGYKPGGVALRAMMTTPRTHLLENEFVKITNRALSAQSIVSSSIAGVAAPGFPKTWLGAQLAMVSRLIAAHGALGQRRQIFFVQQGGYDFHDGLLNDQASKLQELADAMAAFHAANTANGLGANVTTFTASDFGRALVPNNDGSDHGWGSHHLVMGGAVRGGRIWGTMPQVMPGGIEDAGQGRLIPTTSVEQYAAALASWFGVPAAQLSTVVPNVGRFPTGSLGLFS